MARPRRDTYNDLYFSEITTPEQAYWLGFVMCDGCLSERSPNIRLKVALSKADELHLLAFKQALDYIGPIRRYEVGRTGKFISEIILSGRKIVDDLKALGMRVGNKPQSVFPETPGLERHVVRGMLDADGSWGVYREPRGNSIKLKFTIQVTTARHMAERCAAILSRVAGCKSPAIQNGNCAEPDVVAWSISGRGNMQRCANYLYDQAQVFLDRKRDTAIKAWTEKNQYVRAHHPCRLV